MEAQEKTLFGLVAQCKDVNHLIMVAKKVREEGYKNYDTHSPFPIHGMDRAMGLGDSKLGWIVFLFAMLGGVGGFAFMAWTSAVDYPLIISGKPLISTEAFVPVTFELTILFSAFSAVFGMLALNKLPMWYHPVFDHSTFESVTSDSFFVSIEALDPQFDVEKTKGFLERLGATNIEAVYND